VGWCKGGGGRLHGGGSDRVEGERKEKGDRVMRERRRRRRIMGEAQLGCPASPGGPAGPSLALY